MSGTIHCIEDAAAMRAHAKVYRMHAIEAAATGQGDSAAYLGSAHFCEKVADEVAAGRIATGGYRWSGTASGFNVALLNGALRPEMSLEDIAAHHAQWDAK